MKLKRVLSLTLIIIGALLIFIYPVSITGGVVNVLKSAEIPFVIGVFLVIFGLIIFITRTETNYKTKPQELWRETTRILRNAGLDFFGRDKYEKNPKQDEFERRMKTGAYCSQRERHH